MNLDAGEIIALFSLGIASLALWRTEFARVQDLRTGVLKGQTGLRLDLDQLAKTIPQCLQSRQRVAAANGQSGSARVLAEEVAKDLPELTRLRTMLDSIPFPCSGARPSPRTPWLRCTSFRSKWGSCRTSTRPPGRRMRPSASASGKGCWRRSRALPGAVVIRSIPPQAAAPRLSCFKVRGECDEPD